MTDFTKYKIEGETFMVLQEPADNLNVYVKAETYGGVILSTKASILVCGFETISSISTKALVLASNSNLDVSTLYSIQKGGSYCKIANYTLV